MKQINSIFLFIVLTFFIGSVLNFPEEKGGNEINRANMDTTINPANDFFDFANGSWIKNNPVPAEYPTYGSFIILIENNYKKLKKILVQAENNSSSVKGDNAQLVGDFYYSGMDSVKIEEDGYKPIQFELNQIDDIKNLDDFYTVLSKVHLGFSNPLFSFSSSPDAKNSKMVIAELYQDGLGMPDRDYYIKDDPNTKSIKAAYVDFIKNIFSLIGEDSTTINSNVQKILNIETNLAKASMTRVERRDPQKTYHKMNIKQLSEITPDFNWEIYFNSIGVPNPGEINVAQPDFFKEVNSIIKTTPLNDLKIYLKWNVLRFASPYLSMPFENASFDFYSKAINGIQAMQPRWKRVLRVVDRNIGMSLGQLFVKEYFPPEAKEKAMKLVHNLISVLGNRIKNLDWMSAATKEKALNKLSAIGIKIGYPDKWKSYKGLDITRDSYFTDVLNSTIFNSKKELAKIGKPVDRSEWHMTPPTVNAYYNPLVNEIVFPAGILQPPFFDPNADDAVNYGGIGAVIGHEMTHGFDDRGRQYDADGNLKDWWTKSDEEKFNQRAEKIIQQFSNYTPVDTLHMNGKLTEGENIADLGGISISYEAFTNTTQYIKGEKIDGFTPAQRFFLSYANVWRSNSRPQYLTMLIKTNPHSPPKYRVNGPLSNFPPFWKAFNVKVRDPMRSPDDKIVKIW